MPGSQRIKISRSMNLSAASLWELMWRREGLTRWWAADAQVTIAARAQAQLPGHPVAAPEAQVVRLRADPLCVVFTWTSRIGVEPRQLSITVGATKQPRTCRLTLEAIEPDDANRSAVLEFLERRLKGLSALVAEIHRRAGEPRQALIVIHGIGEQQPGETIRELVKGLFPQTEKPPIVVREKPDQYDDTYELRRVTLSATARMPKTDIFEVYWASLVRDTRLDHVTSWVRSLMFRSPRRVPRHLRAYFWSVWVLGSTALAILFLIIFGVIPPSLGLPVAVVSALAAALPTLWGATRSGLVATIGDAARYLDPKPDNVARRQQIRASGVRLLEALHDSGRYDRVIVFGHSLGSVVAFDIVSIAWARANRSHRSPQSSTSVALRALEKSHTGHPDRIHERQNAAWCEHRINTQPWLVTDLITAGSPLAHAEVLLTSKTSSLKELVDARIVASSPPRGEDRKGGTRTFSYPITYARPLTGAPAQLTVPDHAAPFAVTRWTNLYFPVTRGINGDPVGGPMPYAFGPGVKNIELSHPGGGFLGFAHTFYWRTRKDHRGHVDELRKALGLDARRELTELNGAMPAYARLKPST